MRVLIVDDDVWAVRYLAWRLRRVLPDAEIVSRLEPDVAGAFDVYIVDEDFDGKDLAVDLVRQILYQSVDAHVVVLTARLDPVRVQQLTAMGCAACCDKSDPRDVTKLVELVHRVDRRRRNLAI